MKVEMINQKRVEIGNKTYLMGGEVNWFWACKKFSKAECERKSVGYYTLKEESDGKILAFKRLVFLNEDGTKEELPEGIVAVRNPEIIKKLNNWDNNLERSQDENS